MPLYTWSRRTIGLTWLAGLVVEASLVGAAAIQARREQARADVEWERTFGPPGRTPAAPSPEALRRLESLGVKLEMRGDTIVHATLSPAAERQARRIGEVVGQVGQAMAPGIARALLFAAAIYLTVPVALLALTLAWAIARWRASQAPRAA